MPAKESSSGAARAALPSTEAVNWLLRDGVNAAKPGTLLGELCIRLVRERLSIASVVLGIASLDPLVSGTRLRWQSDGARVIEEVMLHGMAGRTARLPKILNFYDPTSSLFPRTR